MPRATQYRLGRGVREIFEHTACVADIILDEGMREPMSALERQRQQRC